MVFLQFANISVSKAQVTFTEGFEWASGTSPTPPQITLPFGWGQGKVGVGSDPDNYWDRVTAAVPGSDRPASDQLSVAIGCPRPRQ